MLLNILKHLKPSSTLLPLRFRFATKPLLLTLNSFQTQKFLSQLPKHPWPTPISSLLSSSPSPSPSPQQIAQTIISHLPSSPLKSHSTKSSILSLIKSDFKFIKPFFTLTDQLKIMRISLRVDFPPELIKFLESYLINMDDTNFTPSMLLLYECLCQEHIKFSIGKDEELFERLAELEKEDFAVVKEFLAIADIAETFFPSKIVSILCEAAAKNVDQFDTEQIIEVFRVINNIKNPSKSFLIQKLTPFLQASLSQVLQTADTSALSLIISFSQKLKLNFLPLITEINKNPEHYITITNNFNFRQKVDQIFRFSKQSVPTQFKQQTKRLLVEYFEAEELVVDVKLLDYFLRNMSVLEEKHRGMLAAWFKRVVEGTGEIEGEWTVKLLKFGSEFGDRESLTKLVKKIISTYTKTSFELYLNICWINRVHKLSLDPAPLLFLHLPTPRVTPDDYMRLIVLLTQLPSSPSKDQYIIKLQTSLLDILKRATFPQQIYIKMINLHLNQTTFRENKRVYIHIQHSIVERWSKELPKYENVDRLCEIFAGMKAGSKAFSQILDMLKNRRTELAMKRIEKYRGDLENGRFKEGQEWWNK